MGRPDSDEAVIRAVYDAFSRRDWDALASRLDPEVEWHEHEQYPSLPARGFWRGIDEAHEYFDSYWSAWHEFTVQITAIERVGDLWVMAAHLSGRGDASSMEVTQDQWHVMRLREGLLTWGRSVLTRDELDRVLAG